MQYIFLCNKAKWEDQTLAGSGKAKSGADKTSP